MISVDNNLPTVYLRPGEMMISKNPSIVMTVLGSCVSVTMYNQRMRVGAISHCLLPSVKKNVKGDVLNVFKFVDSSVEEMIYSMASYGIKLHEIEVKLFGGADVIKSGNAGTVGTQNVQAAVEIFRLNNIKINITHVGGAVGRKLIFYTHTGDVFMKRLRNDIHVSGGNMGKVRGYKNSR